MTYLAPRQGRFAVIVLLSFCLHVLFMVINTENALHKQHTQVAQALAERLADEARMPLMINDRVSLAVIATRYESDPAIAYVGIYGADDKLIVPMGESGTGDSVSINITEDNVVLGKVLVQTTAISRANIITSYWLFLLATLGIHVMLWLIYGYVARPSNALQKEIARDVRDRLLAQNLIPQSTTVANSLPNLYHKPKDTQATHQHPNSPSTQVLGTQASNTQVLDTQNLSTQNTNTQVGDQSLHTQPNSQTTPQTNPQPKKSSGGFLASLRQKFNDKFSTLHKAQDKPSPVQNTAPLANVNIATEPPVSTTTEVSTQKSDIADTMSVQVMFVDKHNLLGVVIDDRARAYFALCDQLLHKAVEKLLATPTIQGISVVKIDSFDRNGALVVLQKDNHHANLALAAAMLGKLIVLVNQVVYDKHRELSYFALPMKTVACDENRWAAASKILAKQPEGTLVLMSAKDVARIAHNINVIALKNPINIYERECRVLSSMSESMAEQLTKLRKQVLAD